MDAIAPGASLREQSIPEMPADIANSKQQPAECRRTGAPPCRIFRPARSVMQAGTRRTKNWVLEFAPGAPQNIEPLMGWTASEDPYAQIRLRFPSREAAVRHAQKLGLKFRTKAAAPRKHRPKNYLETITGRPAH